MSRLQHISQSGIFRYKTIALAVGLAFIVFACAPEHFGYPGSNAGSLTSSQTTPNVLQIPVTVGTDPPWLGFSVDSVAYYAPTSFSWDAGSQHTISTITPQSGGVLASRYRFNDWSDGGTQSHVVTASAPVTYTAHFTNQYLLTMYGIYLPYGLVTPASGFYDQGASVGITAFQTSYENFYGWIGSGVGSYSGGARPGIPVNITMLGPISENTFWEGTTPTATATATPSFTGTPPATATATPTSTPGVVTVTVGTNPARQIVVVDGETLFTSQTFRWIVGSQHTVSVPSPQALYSTSRYVWTSWSNGGEQTHTVTAATDAFLTANLGTQFLLEVCCSGPNGNAFPGGDFYYPGQTISIFAVPANGQKFLGWTGGGSGSYSGPNSNATVTMTDGGITQTARFTGPTATATPTPTTTGTPIPTETATQTPTFTPTCPPATFSNPAAITINDNAAGSPYPSNITVGGLPGSVAKVTVDIPGASHTWPDDVDILLVGPGGQNTILMSDAGGRGNITNLTFTFDDDAAAALPDETQLVGGIFKPTNYETDTDLFPAPAPTPGATVSLSVFNGTSPNGTWALYVRDDVGSDFGNISGGWTLRITTTVGIGCLTPTATNTLTPTYTPTPTNTPSLTPTRSPTATATVTPTATVRITETPGGFHNHHFGSSSYIEDESQVVPITVYRDGNISVATDVFLSMTNGTATGGMTCTLGVDYITASQNVHFDKWVGAVTINVTVCADNIPEPDETVNLSLSGDVGSPSSAVLTINDTAGQFRNASNIAINGGTSGAPYPLTISVSGAPQVIDSMRITLYDYACSFPVDTDFLLIGPQGQNIILLADAGGNTASGPATLNFTDTAGVVVPDTGPLFTGDFEPTSYEPVANFPTPAPTGPYHEPGGRVGGTGTQTLMGNFGGTNPNGTWSLYVRNQTQTTAVIGNVAGGWGIEFTSTLTGTATNTPTPVTGNVTRTVTKIEDTNDGLCDADCSLREAITGAGSGNTIAFSSLFNSPKSITLFNGEIIINQNLTITGTGQDLVTISGNNANRIFFIRDGATVNITGATFRDGNPPTFQGGAILLYGGTLNVSNAKFTNNRANNSDGAAIYGYANTSTLLSHVLVTGNSSEGSAISSYSSIDIRDSIVQQNAGDGLSAQTMNVERCVVSDNTSTNAYNGGGVSAQHLTIVDSTIANNTGGGVRNGDAASTMTIERSLISGNSINNVGGGVWASGTSVIKDSKITNNSSYYRGGGIYNSNSLTLYLINCVVSGNRTLIGAPGDDDGGGGISHSGGNLYVVNSTVSGNASEGSVTVGGGIYSASQGGGPHLYLINSTVANNTSTGSGGGIKLKAASNTSFSNSIVTGNISNNTNEEDVSGTVVSNGINLIGNSAGSAGWIAEDLLNVNPLLGPLADNGGGTLTHALLPGSPAINAGNNSLAVDPRTQMPLIGDQRGFPRFVGNVDIGSYELQTANTPTSTATLTPTFTQTAANTPTNTPTPASVVQFSSAAYFEDESQLAVITLNRTGDLSGTATVSFSTSNGTALGGNTCSMFGDSVDYLNVLAQLVTFNPNEASKTVNVTSCGDGRPGEFDETVNLLLTGENAGPLANAVLTINDTANQYENLSNIAILAGGAADPYPSTITVSGLPYPVNAMRVTIYDYWAVVPGNVDFLLVGPGGQKFVLIAGAGGLSPGGPVTLNFLDTAEVVLPVNGPLTTGDFEPTSYGDVANFPAPAPVGPYNLPGSTIGGTGSQMMGGNTAGTFAGANANGTWKLYVRDHSTSSFAPAAVVGNIGGWGIDFIMTTSAQGSISGRVLTANGIGIRNVTVTVTGNSLAAPKVATTGSFGYFTFEGLATGQTYAVTVNSQRYTFSTPSCVLSLNDNITDANFIAEPQE